MARTELWEMPCSILMWSKRSTQSHTSGSDVEDARFKAGGRLVGTESASGVAGSGFPLPQEARSVVRRSPNISREKVDFILLFMVLV